MAPADRGITRQISANRPALRLIELLRSSCWPSFDGDGALRLPGFPFDMNRFFQAWSVDFSTTILRAWRLPTSRAWPASCGTFPAITHECPDTSWIFRAGNSEGRGQARLAPRLWCDASMAMAGGSHELWPRVCAAGTGPVQEIRRQRIVSRLDREKTFASQTGSRSGNRRPQEACQHRRPTQFLRADERPGADRRWASPFRAVGRACRLGVSGSEVFGAFRLCPVDLVSFF
jgi:hypothetical protein